MRCICFGWRKSSVDSARGLPPSATKSPELSAQEIDDPRIPLTRKEKYVLTKNWKGIAREVTTAGVEMFLKMFTVHPEYYELFAFKNIAGTSKEQQIQNDCLRAHGEAVMKFLGEAITCIENSDKFFQMLEKSGRDHAHKKFFKPEMFWAMEEPFLYAVKLILGERYTDNMDAIYKTVIKLILTGLEDACKMEFSKLNGQGK